MRLPSAEHFAHLIRAVSAVVEEGTFTIDENSMRLSSMDPAHISLVNFELSKAATEEFRCAQALELTVSVSELQKFLRRAGKADSLNLEYDAEKKRLSITLATPSTERIFTLNVLETVAGKTTAPKLTFEAKARVNADILSEAIDDASLVSDYVKVTIAAEAVILSSKGELGTHQTRLAKGGSAVYEITTDKEVSAFFSLNYLDRIIKPSKALSEEVSLELSENRPLKLFFPIQSGKLEFLIAPRVE